jgi:enterochelin esterase-like enzyme
MKTGPHSIILSSFLVLIIAVGCTVRLPASPTPVVIPSTTPHTPTPEPNPTSQPTPTLFEGSFCAYSSGIVEDVSIESKLLSHPLEAKIYLPPCYDESYQEKYPVLYMLHGQTFKNDQWQRIGLLSKADKMILSGEITPLIIVMPYDISWSAGPETSFFDESLVNELLPYIETTYNACRIRECRAVGGLSRGGNWSVYLGFKHPDLFKAIGVHSAPLFYGEILRITNALRVEGAISRLPAIYIDVGNKDENIQQVLAYVELLKENNVPYEFTEFIGYHSEDYWIAHTADYLRWYSEQLFGDS